MGSNQNVGNGNINLHVGGDEANLRIGNEPIVIKNYNILNNKPQINGVELIGNKTFADLGLEIDEMPTENSENAVSSGGVYDALEGKEDAANKVTSIDSASTDAEYPSAKAVYDLVESEKPYLKCVGYWYLLSPSQNHATLEIVNGTSLEEALKQPVRVYVSMNDYPTPDYIGQSLLQINSYESDYIVVFPQSIQLSAFLFEINCGGAKFGYNSTTHLFTFKSFIDGTELKENKVQEIPVADTDHDYASNQYPSIRAIRKMFDDLHTEMESDASASKTLIDLELDANGDLVPTFANIAALPSSTKYGASIAVSLDSDYKVTTTLRDQDGNVLGSAQVIDLPLESVVVGGSYDAATKKVILTLENGNTVEFSVADLVSGLQSEITPSNKLSADLVDDSASTQKFTTEANLTKLAGIEAGAEANVQSDWNVTNSDSDAYIKNKPLIPARTSDLTNDSGFISAESDPTVPSWAKEPTKPTYTYSEVGAQQEPLVGQAYDSSADDYVTPTQVYNALKLGRDVVITYVDPQYGTLVIDTWNIADTLNTVVASTILELNTKWIVYELEGALPSTWARRVDILIDIGALDNTITDFNVRINEKQDFISDLETIRSGAAAGATAVQSINDRTGNTIYLDASDVAAIPSADKGVASGVAELDEYGLVPTSQLPSYVDDVLEYSSISEFPATGETGKIYVDTSTNKTYRWSGSQYVEISPSLALGETSATAYRGDRGKVAYDHAQAHGSAFASGLYKVTTNAEGHVTGATAVVKGDITALGIPAQDTTYNAATQSANGLMSAEDKAKLDGIESGAQVNPATYASSKSAAGPADKAVSIPYAQVDSTSTATAFTATVPGITELRDGVCVLLKNGVVTSAANFTLNINGLGAKGAYSNMAAATRESTTFNVNYTILFVYDETRVSGGCWVYYRGYYSDTNSIGYQIRTNSSRLPAADRVGRYRLLFTSADNAYWVPGNTSDSTSATAAKTVNQRPINPLGPIRYYGYTSVIAANSMPAATYMWQQYVLTLGYTFTPITLNDFAPLYLKCAPQSDGSAIIDATTPVTQTLPSSADGMIYVYLGIATSTTAFELSLEHPVYEYKDGKIREWSNAYVPTKTSELTNDSGFLTNYTETDPTVPAWAKATTKPSYTASEVGAQVSPLVGQINDSTASDYLTPAQVYAAVAAGRQVFASATYQSAPLVFTNFNSGVDTTNGSAVVVATFFFNLIVGEVIGSVANGSWRVIINILVDDTIYGQIPDATSQLTNDGANGTSTYVEADELATVAISGSYNDLTDTPPAPSIPTKTSDLLNDSDFTTQAYVDGLVGNVEAALAALR